MPSSQLKVLKVHTACRSKAALAEFAVQYLDCNSVLIHGQNLASCEGVELREENAEGRPVACEGLVRNEMVWHVLSTKLHSRLALGQGVSLCKEVAHELIVVGDHLTLQSNQEMISNHWLSACVMTR